LKKDINEVQKRLKKDLITTLFNYLREYDYKKLIFIKFKKDLIENFLKDDKFAEKLRQNMIIEVVSKNPATIGEDKIKYFLKNNNLKMSDF